MKSGILRFFYLFVLSAAIIGIFHTGFAFADDGKVTVVATDKTYLSGFADSAWNWIKDVIKQILLNIHQTIILTASFWLIGLARRVWGKFQPKIDALVDEYLSGQSLDRRKNIKKTINEIIVDKIDIVEAAFKGYMHKDANGNEVSDKDASAAIDKSKKKLITALGLITNELIVSGIDKSAFADGIGNEEIKKLIKEIEIALLKRDGIKEDNTEEEKSGLMPIATSLSLISEKKLEEIKAKPTKRFTRLHNLVQDMVTYPATTHQMISNTVDSLYVKNQ